MNNIMSNCDDSFYKTILDTIPVMIFVFDDDIRVRDFNTAAEKIFVLNKPVVLNRKSGDVLKCLHRLDTPEGCGHGPACKECVIKYSVHESILGEMVYRRRARVHLQDENGVKDHEFFITSSRLPVQNEPLSLVVIEDMTEFYKLREIIPICSNCKKIRDDMEYWRTVEEYFSKLSGIDFSHGICPECVDVLYPGYAEKTKNRKK